MAVTHEPGRLALTPLTGRGARQGPAESFALHDRLQGTTGSSRMVAQGGGDAGVACQRRMLMARLRRVA